MHLACASPLTSTSTKTSFEWKPAHTAAQPVLLNVPLERGVNCPIYWMPHDAARTTLALFPGGVGSLAYDATTNAPLSKNFLIRSRELFHKAGFNIACVDRPQDRTDLELPYRKSAEHICDIRTILLYLKKLAPVTLWLVGTSRGTVSAASATIDSPDLVAGLVLTASITMPGHEDNVQSLELGNISVPTLVLHHRKDACWLCPPEPARYILSGLKNSPLKKLVFISGGSGASGDPCMPLHFHGFINQEEEAVIRIASWIRNASGAC